MVVALTALLLVAYPPAEGLLSTASVLVLLGMTASQAALGAANDWLDRRHDALTKPRKPIPALRARPEGVATISLVCLALALLAAFGLGVLPLLLVALGTACGYAYNLGLKRTAWSWLSYIAGFSFLPPFVWSVAGIWPSWRDAGIYPVGLPLVLAAHLANVLPDVEAERGLVPGSLGSRLGVRRGSILAMGCVAAAWGALVGQMLAVRGGRVEIWGLLSSGALAAAIAGHFILGSRRPERLRWGYRALATAALLVVAGELLVIR